MKKNVGYIDKVIRILAAIVIGGMYFANQISGLTAILLLLVAGIFIITSFMSFCPIYFVFGLSSRKKQL